MMTIAADPPGSSSAISRRIVQRLIDLAGLLLGADLASARQRDDRRSLVGVATGTTTVTVASLE